MQDHINSPTDGNEVHSGYDTNMGQISDSDTVSGNSIWQQATMQMNNYKHRMPPNPNRKYVNDTNTQTYMGNLNPQKNCNCNKL